MCSAVCPSVGEAKLTSAPRQQLRHDGVMTTRHSGAKDAPAARQDGVQTRASIQQPGHDVDASTPDAKVQKSLAVCEDRVQSRSVRQ